MFYFRKGIQRALFFLRTSHQQYVFSALFPVKTLGELEIHRFFVHFRDFSNSGTFSIAENLKHCLNVLIHVLGRGVERKRHIQIFIFFKHGAFFSRLIGQKADKGEPVRGKRGQHQPRHERARTWHDGILFPRLAQNLANDVTWV